MKRRLATAVVAAGFIALSPAAALAYGAPSPNVGVSDGVVAPGEAVVFAGTGFAPGSTVSIFVTYNGPASAALAMILQTSSSDDADYLGDVETDDDGAFAVDIEFGEPGSYTLVAQGVDSDGNERTLTSNVSVAGESGSGSSGSDSSGGSGSTSGSGSMSGSGSTGGGVSMQSGSGTVVSRNADRVARSTSTGGELARTGVDGLGLQVGAAVGLVVVGGAAVGATAVRRRRASA